MSVTLTKSLAPNSPADEADVRRVKYALNRLGYYHPEAGIGMTTVPDRAMFEALKQFQSKYNLPVTGVLRPEDETLQALHQAMTKDAPEYYIWRSVSDDKVRTSHAALNGKKRSINASPAPGAEHNCRCWMEPVALKKKDNKEQKEEGLTQIVISEVNDSSVKWDTEDFIWHFRYGGGRTKTLAQIGYLADVINKAREIMFWKVEGQVADKMRHIQEGNLIYKTENSYSKLSEVRGEFGGGTIRTRTEGIVKREKSVLSLEATVEYEYYDLFTDPINARQWFIYGTSSPDGVPDWIVNTTDLGGTYYAITGAWKTRMTGQIHI